MEVLRAENVSFRYKNSSRMALNDIDLSVSEGDFVLLCGESGSGKSTFLRLLKPALCPYGQLTGVVKVLGEDVYKMDGHKEVSTLGFVSQNPESQLVTEKVWHEMAFGLENLGVPQREMELRIGEMASYFGIEGWFHKNVKELSGGQKQKLNLSSIMVMNPKILLLDEPTSMLDPIAAGEFLAMVQKLNEELGITVLLVEHNMEEALSICNKVVVLDKGRLRAHGNARDVASSLRHHSISRGFPTVTRCFLEMKGGEDFNIQDIPLTISEGRSWLRKFTSKESFDTDPHVLGQNKKGISEKTDARVKEDLILRGENITFRYEKKGRDILSDLSFFALRGECHAIMGGNGTGKSTLLSILAGLKKPLYGKIKTFGKISFLPQNPQIIFVKDRVMDDLMEVLENCEDGEKRAEAMLEMLGLKNLKDAHPYDLSGGEQQRLAIGKILLTEPDIMLLDEPTKGIDSFAKDKIGHLLREISKEGRTVIMVSHDVEFCSKFAHRCSLLFDGRMVGSSKTEEFFVNNRFYTTSTCKMTKDVIKTHVRLEDLISTLENDNCAGNKSVDVDLSLSEDFELGGDHAD